MRHFYLVPALVIAISVMAWPPAYAIGNVLVPADDDSPPATPANPPDSQTPAAHESPETLLPETDGMPDMPPESSPKPATLGYTPMALSSAALMKMLDQKPPTQILKIPSSQDIRTSSDGNLTGALNVSMPAYQWGPDDVASINRTLGIPADQVSKYCQLAAFGTLASDTGGYIFNVDASQSQAVLRYSGKPSGLTVMAQAKCDKVPLPPNAGIVLQSGDKYIVFITQIRCPPPDAGTHGLVFQYAGNGRAQCVYQ